MTAGRLLLTAGLMLLTWLGWWAVRMVRDERAWERELDAMRRLPPKRRAPRWMQERGGGHGHAG